MSSTLLPSVLHKHPGPTLYAAGSGDRSHASSAVQSLDLLQCSRILAAFPPRHAQALARQFGRIRQQASALDAAAAVQMQCVLALQQEQLRRDQTQVQQRQQQEQQHQHAAIAESAVSLAAAERKAVAQHDGSSATVASGIAVASEATVPTPVAPSAVTQVAAGPAPSAAVSMSQALPAAPQPPLSDPAQPLPSAPATGVSATALLPVSYHRLRHAAVHHPVHSRS